MKKLWILGSVALLASASCTRKVYLPVEKVKTVADSASRVAVRADSVWIRDSVVLIQKGDTVRERLVRDRVRTIVRCDTLWRLRTDTVSVHVTSPPERGGTGDGSYAGWVAALVLAAVLMFSIWVRRR